MSPQSSIAHYRITSKLGEGGMGAVYRATDTKLGRDVAIKVLPDSFAEDADRLGRFTREAKVLASLNHPNIAAIHGVEDRAIVMELVEGATLAGPLPIEEALPLIHQLIDALEYAHENGVIHRDLKPANIKVTPEGRVKVLDFGLAKAMGRELASGDPVASPTLTMKATMGGMILGTAAYMSPEQARGQTVDKRADIWAFGVVLYELLTGRQLFEGPTVSDTLAAVLRQEPELERVPPQLRRLVKACLVRDARQRLRDISGARLLLDDAPAPTRARAVEARPNRLPWLLSAVFLIALAAVLTLYLRRPAPEVHPTRFTMHPPEGASFLNLAVSPDGRQLAFAATDANSKIQLWVRPLDTLVARVLAGTEGARDLNWSLDGRFLLFWAEGKLKKVDASGGPPQTLASVPAFRGSAWNTDGTILYGTPSGMFVVPAAGGEPKQALPLDTARHEISLRWPAFLPGGRYLLYTVLSSDPENTGIYVGSVGSAERNRLLPDDSNAAYTEDSAGRGFILFSRSGNLMAQRFDASARRLVADATPVAEQVATVGVQSRARFSISSNGTLVYMSGAADSNQLTWFDRSGKRLGTAGERGLGGSPRISPDGKRIMSNQVMSGTTGDLYIIDIARDISSRFTFNRTGTLYPVWTPDGTYVYYASSRAGVFDIVRKASSGAGTEEVVLHSELPKFPGDVSADGKFLLFTQTDPKNAQDIYVLPLGPSGDNKPVPVLSTPATEQSATFSPDGKWIAYASDESGRPEVYVRPFSPGGQAAGQWQASKDGGQYPRWRSDGKELYFWSGNGRIAAVSIDTRNGMQIGLPEPLMPANLSTVVRFTVTPDGQRFLFGASQNDRDVSPATVVLNWNGLGR